MAEFAIARSYVPQPVTPPPPPPVLYHNVFHAPPPSIEAADWVSFDKFTTDIFERGFYKDKDITVSLRIPTVKEGYFKAKQELRWKNAELSLNDELRFWFPLTWRRQSYLYAHKLNDRVRLYYDNGYSKVSSYNINAYASFDFLKDFRNYNASVGVAHTNGDLHTNARLRIYDDKVRFELLRHWSCTTRPT